MSNDRIRKIQAAFRQRRMESDPEGWKKKHRDYERARRRGAAYRSKHAQIKAERNEKCWRFSMWEASRISPEVKDLYEYGATVINRDDFNNPIFIVIHSNGKTLKENLNDPLPSW